MPQTIYLLRANATITTVADNSRAIAHRASRSAVAALILSALSAALSAAARSPARSSLSLRSRSSCR